MPEAATPMTGTSIEAKLLIEVRTAIKTISAPKAALLLEVRAAVIIAPGTAAARC